jgi:hypothetical protein
MVYQAGHFRFQGNVVKVNRISSICNVFEPNFLAYFPHFHKIRVGLHDLHAVSPLSIDFRMP